MIDAALGLALILTLMGLAIALFAPKPKMKRPPQMPTVEEIFMNRVALLTSEHDFRVAGVVLEHHEEPVYLFVEHSGAVRVFGKDAGVVMLAGVSEEKQEAA